MRSLTENVLLGIVVLGALESMYGCATQPAKLPAPTPVATCLPMRTYTKVEQDAARAQLQTIPADSALARWIVDYGALRDANRAACQSK